MVHVLLKRQMIDFFFSPDRPVSLVLNLVIAALTAVALVEMFREWKRVVRPTRVDLDALRSHGPHPDADSLLHFANDAAPGQIVQRRLELLRQFRTRAEPVDIEMLAAISAESFRDAAPIARLATSTLVLLGLAGTLVGLSLAVSGLPSLLRGAPDVKHITDAILMTLGQVKVAFSTTLAGVTGSILVGFALAGLRHRQSTVIRALEELSTTEWTPLFQTTEQSRISDAVRELEATREVLTRGLDETLKHVRAGFEALGTQFRDQGATLFGQVSALRDATLEIIGERGEDSLSLAQYVETVKSTTDQLQDSVRASGELLPRVQQALDETIRSEREALSASLSEHTQAVRPVLERQEAAAEALSAAVSGELARLSEVKDVLDRLNKSFEAARGTWEHADQSIERMGRETATALRDGLRESMSAIARLTEEQARSQQRVTTVVDGFQETYQETMRLLGDQSRRAFNQSQEMVEEIRATLRESLDLVKQELVASQSSGSKQITAALKELSRELRDLSASPAPSGHGGVARSTQQTNKKPPTDGSNGRPAAPSDRSGSTPATLYPLDTPPEKIREDLEGLE